MNPQLPPEAIMVEREDRFLFLIPSKPDWVVTNANGAYVLSLCDGKNSKESILKIVHAKGLDTEKASKFLSRLLEDHFFDDPKEQQKASSIHNPILQSVHLNMSQDCNLNCRHCYAEEREKKGKPLSFEQHIQLIDDLTELSNKLNIEFTGGEPLLNKKTPEIAMYCREKGHHTRLLTNGTPINKRNVEKIVNSFNNVRLSIDGSSKELNDFHRGEGTYTKINKALELLDKYGANVLLAMTVTKKNIGDIGTMAKKYGSRLTFQPLFDAGNAKINQEMAITGSEYYEALAHSENVAVMGGIGSALGSLKNRGVTKCAIGDVEISIAHNGDVFPCHLVHLEEFNAGNILEASIKDIYKHSAALNTARHMTIYARPECSECAIRLLCGGSCRARALYLEGDINACDDFCDYEFSAYLDGIFQNSLLTTTSRNVI